MRRHDWTEADSPYYDKAGFWDRWDRGMDKVPTALGWLAALGICILAWVHGILPLIGRLFD